MYAHIASSFCNKTVLIASLTLVVLNLSVCPYSMVKFNNESLKLCVTR